MSQTLLTIYLIGSTLGLFFISTAWSKSGWLNVFIKGTFGLLGFVGFFLTLKMLGLI